MGWNAVWHLVLKQFAAEAIEIRILAGLVLALCVLMMIEGGRTLFRSAGPQEASAAPPPESVTRTVCVAAPPKPFRARKIELRKKPVAKRVVQPKIRKPDGLGRGFAGSSPSRT